MHRVSHGRSRREERAKVKWSEEWSEVIVEKDDNRRMRCLIRTRCVGLLCGVEQNTAEDANEGRRGRQEESQEGPDSQGEAVPLDVSLRDKVGDVVKRIPNSACT